MQDLVCVGVLVPGTTCMEGLQVTVGGRPRPKPKNKKRRRRNEAFKEVIRAYLAKKDAEEEARRAGRREQ